MPALHETPAPVTMTERFDFDICVDSVERRIRCSGVGFSIEIWTVIFNQKRCLTELFRNDVAQYSSLSLHLHDLN